MTTSITSGSYPRRASPASSLWQRLSQGTWRFLQELGDQRVRHHLELLARQHDALNPELARQLRDAARHSMDS